MSGVIALDEPFFGVLDALDALDPDDDDARLALRLACCQRCQAGARQGVAREELDAACPRDECACSDGAELAALQRWMRYCRARFANPEVPSDEEYATLNAVLFQGHCYGGGLVRTASGYLDFGWLAPTLRGVVCVNLLMEIGLRAGVVFFGNVRQHSGHAVKELQETFRERVMARLQHTAPHLLRGRPPPEVARLLGVDPKTARAWLARPGQRRKRRGKKV